MEGIDSMRMPCFIKQKIYRLCLATTQVIIGNILHLERRVETRDGRPGLLLKSLLESSLNLRALPCMPLSMLEALGIPRDKIVE